MNTAAVLTNSFFLGAILFCYFSGNDKAPYLVLTAAGVSFVVALGFFLRRRWKAALAIAVPALYTGLVIVLARQGLVDSQVFLGFR